MALDLTDTELDALAERARRVLNAPSKQDAVRQALERVVETEPRADADISISNNVNRSERLRLIQQKYLSLGALDPNFDEKKFLDEMWQS